MPLSPSRGISLIGPMGAGKTTVGRILAGRLRRRFVDIDALIEMNSNRQVAEIIREDGEERFRELEELALAEATGAPGSVLACGGGVVVRPGNIERLRGYGLIVFLKVPARVASSRIDEPDSRPLLVGDPLAALSRLIQEREHLYLEASDVVSDAAAPVDEVIAQLLAVINE